MKTHTFEAYISGGIYGNTWMPCAMAGKAIRENLQGPWGFYQKGDSFREALESLLMREGGDFRDAKFTADTELVFVMRTPSRHSSHIRTVIRHSIVLYERAEYADLCNVDAFTSDFTGEE